MCSSDLVDATGRRSPLPSLLEAIGALAPEEEVEDSGFMYYGRHFRSLDGSQPPAFGPLLQHYDSISVLTLPADNGTWGMGIITSARDAPLRAAREVEVWERVIASYPLIAHWLNGDPITATDFVYTIRRGLTPELASTNAPLAYYIRYAQAFNEGAVFVLDPGSQTFLLEKDILAAEEPTATQQPGKETTPSAKTPGRRL